MMKTITATEAVRKFSEILNPIKYTGTDSTIMRGGTSFRNVPRTTGTFRLEGLNRNRRLFLMLPYSP